MGGLVTRAYTVGMAKDLFGNSASYNANIDKIAFLSTPHRGGRFAYIASLLSPLGFVSGRQYAVSQLEVTGSFIRELNGHALIPEIRYFAIGGYDNSFLHWWISSNTGPRAQGPLDLVADIILSMGPSDCWVTLQSALSGPSSFFSQYKIIYRNHANIYMNETPIWPASDVVNYLQDFYQDGVINSDNILTYIWKGVLGDVIGRVIPSSRTGGGNISGAEIKLFRNGYSEPYLTYSDASGKFSFNYLPSGNYTMRVSAGGYLSDSTTIVLNDSLTQAPRNLTLSLDTAFVGPGNAAVTINSGSLFTNSLSVDLTLHAENASEMRVSEDFGFINSSWQPFSTTTNHVFADSSVGLKFMFAKFRNASGVESNVVIDGISYYRDSTAQIEVSSSMNGATVLLNGSFSGHTTPVTISGVPFGDYSVSVFRSGFASLPTLVPLTVSSSQTYNTHFTLTNIPPQAAKYFSYLFSADTLKLMWETPSDIDLNRTKINYRLDGIFPVNPDDGINIYNQPTPPDRILNTLFVGMPPNTPYYFAVFAVDSGGLYSSPRTLVATLIQADVKEKEIPTVFSLAQNYPNPFNPTTTMEFALPKSCRATLKVYDLLGKEVATLVDENLPVGVHKAQWNASDVASGVYFYRLQAGSFVETKKLLLLR